MAEIRLVAPTHDRCGEAAVWVAAESALYWCDIGRFVIHRYDLAAAALRSWTFEEPVVAIAPTDRDGTLVVALASRVLAWTPATGAADDFGFRLPGYPKVRLNDGRADPLGNFWVGSMENNIRPDGDLDLAVEGHWTRPGLGTLFRIGSDGRAAEMRRTIGISNTVCWSPDSRTFYFGDTIENEIRAYDFDPATASISNERVFFAGFERGAPDGSAIDAEGFLWNCRFGGACVVRVAPDGTVDRVVEVPCTDVTTCTFGGPDLGTLFVTTAAMRGHAGERLAGSLFALEPGVAGLPERVVALGPRP